MLKRVVRNDDVETIGWDSCCCWINLDSLFLSGFSCNWVNVDARLVKLGQVG